MGPRFRESAKWSLNTSFSGSSDDPGHIDMRKTACPFQSMFIQAVETCCYTIEYWHVYIWGKSICPFQNKFIIVIETRYYTIEYFENHP